MQQIIMTYCEGDGFTYSCTVTTPIMYSSAEAALVDFEKLVDEAVASKTYNFEFCGSQYASDDFFTRGGLYRCLPEFLTVDEWFLQNCNNLNPSAEV